MATTNQYQPETSDSLFNVQQLASKLLAKWYLLIASVMVCMGIAYFIDRYTKPVYTVGSMVYIKTGNDKTNLASMLYGEEAFSSTRNLSNEIIFLKSHSLIEETINDLDLGISYYKKGKFVTSEMYKSSPIEVIIDTSSKFIPYYTDFTLTIKSRQTFALRTEDENLGAFNKTFKFDEVYTVQGFTFAIKLKYLSGWLNEEVIFTINSLDGLIGHYKNSLYISTVGKESSVLKLSLEGTTPEKDIDFLNTLSNNFIANNLEEKNSIALKTVGFINQMLRQNKDSLATIENKLEQFKGSNTVVSVQEKGSQIMEDIKQLEKDRAALLTADQYFDYLEKNLQQEGDRQVVIPSSLGVQDAALNTAITEMIVLQSENQMLKSEGKLKNPFIEVNNQKIAEIKSNILQRIRSLRAINAITLADLNKRINQYVNSQQKLPSAEREFNDISRNYSISESLVQFLMEKRAEAGITSASNASDYKSVDTARVESGPLKKKPFDYKMALLIGLVIPVGFVLLSDFLNNKISSREELLKLSPLPLLGIIVHGNAQKTLAEKGRLKSALSESLRSVRSNLSYISENNGVCKVILLTSSISGEGKSFCSTNIGHILSISGKKTLIINADMRKPSSYEKELGIKNGVGLSNFLSGMVPLEEVVQKSQFENLCVVQSGDLPPNASELLLSIRMQQMLSELRESFDFIILDTPPVGIISDALELMKQSDVNIIVVRQGYTQKSFLMYINELYHNQKIKNMALVLNDVDMKKSTYGYGINQYGYGYYVEETRKKWWRKSKSKEII